MTRVVDGSADPAAIRREIAANLATGDDFVLVNYARRALGQQGGGHISPLGAYDERSDSFLIMDVNPNRAPWVWVRSDDLIAAMRTFDTSKIAATFWYQNWNRKYGRTCSAGGIDRESNDAKR